MFAGLPRVICCYFRTDWCPTMHIDTPYNACISKCLFKNEKAGLVVGSTRIIVCLEMNIIIIIKWKNISFCVNAGIC